MSRGSHPDRRAITFQQKLDAAYAEAKKETKREEAREAKWLAEMRRRGVTVQGGTTTTAAQRLLAKVEERMGLEKLALKARVERFLGMCVTEIVIGLNPLPHFSLKLRSKRPNGTCS